VANGGLDRGTAYVANLNYTINLDLMRMELIPGALIKFRVETRYGSSVNTISARCWKFAHKGTSSMIFPFAPSSTPDRTRLSANYLAELNEAKEAGPCFTAITHRQTKEVAPQQETASAMISNHSQKPLSHHCSNPICSGARQNWWRGTQYRLYLDGQSRLQRARLL
jgi:hypothetical protein